MIATYDIKRLALISSINAEIEAMKAANIERQSKGYALAYNEEAFHEASNQLREIAFEIRQSKNKKGVHTYGNNIKSWFWWESLFTTQE